MNKPKPGEIWELHTIGGVYHEYWRIDGPVDSPGMFRCTLLYAVSNTDMLEIGHQLTLCVFNYSGIESGWERICE